MTFQGETVFDLRPNFEKIEFGQLDDFTFDSRGQGVATPWKKTSGPKRKATYPYILGTAEEISSFRKLIESVHGRLRGFWLPIILNEYAITQNQTAGQTSVTVENVGLLGATASFGQFGFVFLMTADKLECYEISSVSTAGDTEIINLTTGLLTNLTAVETLCGGLIWARLETDPVEIDFDSDGVAMTTLTFLELPAEYVTPHEGTAPMYLYEISSGGTNFHYTNWGARVAFGCFEWTPADITHGEVRSGIEFISEGLQLMVGTDDLNHPLRVFLQANALDPVTVTIWKTDYFTDGLDVERPLYKGRLGRVSFGEKGDIDGEVSSILRLNERTVPSKDFERKCVHRLYDAFCTVNEASFTTAGTLDTVTDTYVEATEFGDKATTESDPNWFAFGKVKVGDEIRLCIGQAGNRLYLNAAFRFAVVTDAATAIAGCDKLVGTCVSKFNNLVNNLSFPYIPNSNPQFSDLLNPKPSGGKK